MYEEDRKRFSALPFGSPLCPPCSPMPSSPSPPFSTFQALPINHPSMVIWISCLQKSFNRKLILLCSSGRNFFVFSLLHNLGIKDTFIWLECIFSFIFEWFCQHWVRGCLAGIQATGPDYGVTDNRLPWPFGHGNSTYTSQWFKETFPKLMILHYKKLIPD